MVGVEEKLEISDPYRAVLPHRITFFNVGLLLLLLCIPPPLLMAELPEKVTLVNVGLLPNIMLYIPPPL